MLKVGNNEYTNAHELAKHYNAGYKKTIELLLKYGDFSNPEITKQLQTGLKSDSVIINGVRYASVKDAAKIHNMSLPKLNYNLKHYGYKTDLVFKIRDQIRNIDWLEPLVINGVKFENLFDLLSNTSLSKAQFLKNLRDVGDNDDRIWLMHNAEAPYALKVHNQVFRSRGQMLAIYGVSSSSFKQSMKIYQDCYKALIYKPNGNYRFSLLTHIQDHMPFYLKNKFDEFMQNAELNKYMVPGDGYVDGCLVNTYFLRMDKLFEFYSKVGVFK